jgi:hypothetical protein
LIKKHKRSSLKITMPNKRRRIIPNQIVLHLSHPIKPILPFKKSKLISLLQLPKTLLKNKLLQISLINLILGKLYKSQKEPPKISPTRMMIHL